MIVIRKIKIPNKRIVIKKITPDDVVYINTRFSIVTSSKATKLLNENDINKIFKGLKK